MHLRRSLRNKLSRNDGCAAPARALGGSLQREKPERMCVDWERTGAIGHLIRYLGACGSS